MPLEPEFLAWFTDTVSIARQTSIDAYGKPTYAAAITSAAFVEPHTRLVRNTEGREVVSQVTVFLPGTVTIAVVDKITLPNGTTPPIISVSSPRDEVGVHHHEAYV